MHLTTLGVFLSVALADAASLVAPNRHKANKVSPNLECPNITAWYIYSYALGIELPRQMLSRPM